MGREMTKGHRKFWGGDRCVCFLDCSDGFVGIHMCPKHQIVHLKYVQVYVNYTSLKLFFF